MVLTMSLRFRLNLLITLMFVVILITGAVLVIQHARKAVAEETQSTANLTLQLLEVAFDNIGPQADPVDVIVSHLGRFEKTRHLHIDLVGTDGLRNRIAPYARSPHETEAPDWFVRLVRPPLPELTREVAMPGATPMQIAIRADPADEIREVWRETRAMLGLLLSFCLLANGLVFFTVGRSLKPIDSILKALDNVEQGDYRSRLPTIGLPELDIVARKFNHMAEALDKSRERNRHLAQKSLAIQEQERRFLAHELHDEMGQSISAIKALAFSIGQRGEGQPEIAAAARTIAETSHRIYDVVRGMMRRLRPVVLDELGLVPALQNIVDEWNERHEDTFCRFAAEGEFANLSDEIKINLYRIVQEALTNVARHARATGIAIDLRRCRAPDTGAHETVELTIADNGVGVTAPVSSPGLGLLGMRERAEALDGHFELRSQAAMGVTIQVRLPIKGTSNE